MLAVSCGWELKKWSIDDPWAFYGFMWSGRWFGEIVRALVPSGNSIARGIPRGDIYSLSRKWKRTSASLFPILGSGQFHWNDRGELLFTVVHLSCRYYIIQASATTLQIPSFLDFLVLQSDRV